MNHLLPQLNDLLQNAPDSSLWCIDENLAGFAPAHYLGAILTNRFDIADSFAQRGNLHFSDFDFSPFPEGTLSWVLFRIAKEKAINLHILSEALPRLKEDGRLFLLGYKNEGILSLASRMEESGGCKALLQKMGKQLYLLEVSATPAQQETSTVEEKHDYASLQRLAMDGLDFYTKPGIFGWNKIDTGSRLLMDVAEQHHLPTPEEKVLDLGCGYGYLSIRAHQMGFRQIDATDNNAAAIHACRQNFSLHNISGSVLADDMASHNREKYEVILCNPPFHQGFSHHKELTAAFLRRLSCLLARKGEIFLVTNQFIAVERYATTLFSSVEPLEKSVGFKVIRLSR